MARSEDVCDGDYLGAYRRFLEHFVSSVCSRDDQLPVMSGNRDVRECELPGEIAHITLQHLNQRLCPASLQAYLVKLVIDEFRMTFQQQPEDCGYRPQERKFSPLKLMQCVTSKVNEICKRYLDNSRLALLPPPPSTPLPLTSSHAIKNKRRKMEDRFVVLHDLHTMFSIKNDAVVNYYAVFDGHGGQEAAVYCAAHLHQYLVESPYYPVDPELALQDAFHKTDKKFIECDDKQNSGSTAVCALLYDKTLYMAWAGDSQAALIKSGRGIDLTMPHKPEREDEKLRVESLGGEIIHYGTYRVNGLVSVSRSLGDPKHKPFVTAEPEIVKIQLDGTEDFLIIACDGFWDKADAGVAASLLYEYVGSGSCEYESPSEALVSWAKQNLSDDNITVIVVYLTPPNEIAAKGYYNPRPAQLAYKASSMEPGLQQPELQQPASCFDLDFGFPKQQQQQQQPLQQTNGDGFGNGSFIEGMNGKHRPKPPKYNDDDEDEDEDEEDEEEEEDDLGPETNVDAVDEAPEDFVKIERADVTGSDYDKHEFIGAKLPLDNDAPTDDLMADLVAQKHRRNELIAESDNVAAESEDSEEEWNYYRPEEQKGKDQEQQQSNGVGKDPSLVEKLDQCEEREPCSPKPHEENSLGVDNQQQLLRPGSAASNEPETDDVTAEFDELHEPGGLAASKNQHQFESRELQFELENTEIEAEITLPADELPLDKDLKENLPNSELELERELLREDVDGESSIEDDEDMESHLNPDAAEFVPTSPPVNAQLISPMSSDLIAGSPLKQSQRALKNRKIPSEEEFKNEICRRPSEIDDNDNLSVGAPEHSNGDASPCKDASSILVGGGFDDTKHKTQINLLDQSEVSSTKAEFGDESNFSVTSELFKTGASNSSFASDRCDFDFSSSNAMTTSMTPADFKSAFEQQPDLNKVHELNDDDLMSDELNGSIGDQDEHGREIVRDLELSQENIDLDSFAPQQQQSAELFTSIAEQKESSNSDLFSGDEKPSHDEELGLSSSNPFSSSFDPLEPKSSEQHIQGLADDLQKVSIEVEQPKEPQPSNDVMLNPLSLNIGSASAEQRADEPVLVSPIKEPEVMTSKFAEEEDLVSDEQLDEFSAAVAAPLGANNVDLLGVDSKVNLSESLQEFTQLEEKLSPVDFGIQDNQVAGPQPPLLKENLVDEQKDVEELAPTPEAKINDAPLVSNEVIAPVAVAATVAAVAAAAAKPTKSTASATKASKPAAKLGSKTPASPTKTAAPKPASTTAAKKPASTGTAAPRPKAVSSTPAKPALSKTATTGATKPAATTRAASAAPKATPRATPAAPKTKPLGSLASKTAPAAAAATPNGDAKPATRTSLAPRPAAARTAPAKTAPLGRPTAAAAARTSAGATTAAAAKPRPASATTATKTASSRLSSAGVTSSTNGSGAARPKTAPATAKPRPPLTKSPVTDKQTKETANKQISSARATAAAAASKTRQATVSSTSATAKRASLAPKAAPGAATSPAKKPAPIARPGAAAKATSGVAAKANPKVSSTTKSGASATPVAKPLQNGTCEPDSDNITTSTTANTTNIEEDIPKKDVSPIEQPTDNQLIAVE